MKSFCRWVLGVVASCFLMHMTDDFFLLSFSAMVFAIPFFLVTEMAYLVVSHVARRRMRLVLSWLDFPTVCFSIAAWGFIVSAETIAFSHKSLANLIEPGIFTSLWVFLYAVRCYHAYKGNLGAANRWGRISAVAIPMTAILFAFLFPGLPE